MSDHDDMERRDLLRALTMTGTLLAIPAGRAIAMPRDGDGSERFGTPSATLWQAYATAANKRTTYPLVRGELDLLITRLEHPGTAANRRLLCARAADLFQLAGEIFFDANRYTDAAHCYTLAASAAKDADDYDLWACALTRHAYITLYDSRPRHTIDILEAAARVASRGDPQLATRHWIAATKAEAAARSGHNHACEQALDLAEQAPAPVDDGPAWLRFDTSRLAELRGSCYVQLADFDRATTALGRALEGELTNRRSAGVLTDLALVGIHQRDVDAVLTHGAAAAQLAGRTGSGYIAQRLRPLRTHLTPTADSPRLIELAQQIDCLAGASH